MEYRDFLPKEVRTTGDVLSPLSKEHRQRADLINLYWRYYRGHHRPNIKVKAGQADDNITINWSKKVVNAGVSFLMGKPPTFEIDDQTNERTPDEAYLDEVWADDPARRFVKQSFFTELAQSGAVSGTAFVRIYPKDERNDKPRLVILDPATVDILHDPNDISDVLGYHIVWQAGDNWHRHRIERDGDLMGWTIFDEIYDKGGRWRENEPPITWEWDFAPVFHCQNLTLAHSPWGVSDLEDADLNDAVNNIASNINRILRFHAHPKTVGTGFAPNAIDVAADGLITLPEGATIQNLEMQSDLASSAGFQARMEEAFHQVTDVPRFDPASVNLGALSGFALQVLYSPLLQKTNVKRANYGGLLQQINRALLVLDGKPEAAVMNHWENPLPMNSREKYENFEILVRSGVSVYSAALFVWKDPQIADMLSQVDMGLLQR